MDSEKRRVLERSKKGTSLPIGDAGAVLSHYVGDDDGYCGDDGEYLVVPQPASEILPSSLVSFLEMTIHHREPRLEPAVKDHLVRNTQQPLRLDTKAVLAAGEVDDAVHGDNDKPGHHQRK